MRFVISSGHGKYVRGASGYVDEVNEARRVVDQVAAILNNSGHTAIVFHDDVSTSQNENLNRIVNFHNSKSRDVDVSVHFNAYETTQSPMGTEVLYVSSSGLAIAEPLVDQIASVGFTNRGPKKRTDLFFLNNTHEPAVLIETCFCDSKADTDLYKLKFDEVCSAICAGLLAEAGPIEPPGPVEPPDPTDPPVSFTEEEQIKRIAMGSKIANYYWKDRGHAPDGYIQGFALAWATVVKNYIDGRSTALEQAKAGGHPDYDVMAWYKEEFERAGMAVKYSGLPMLRHLYTFLYGLGMRESSGQHCCGRDQSADNVSSDTCEAGLYQTSYNAHTCSDEFDKVMNDYQMERFPDYVDVFSDQVSCSPTDWENYGSGKGRDFQELCKNCPPFAMESAAITLRNRRQHYGPVNRKEVELKAEAEWMLLDVQRYITRERSVE